MNTRKPGRPRDGSLMRRSIIILAALVCAACAQQAGAQQAVIDEQVGIDQPLNSLPPAKPTAMPTPTLVPALAVSPTASPTSWDPISLTHGGCCPGAFWSSDSQEVRFLARPVPTQPASIYSVPRTGGSARLVVQGPAWFSADDAYRVTASGEDVAIERVEDGKRWLIPTSGRAIHFSHSMQKIAWTESSEKVENLDLIHRSIWISNVDGSTSANVVTVVGGGFLGWTQNDEAILVSGGLRTGGPRGVWRVPSQGGEPQLLIEAQEVEGALVSPAGGWLAFYIAFGDDPSRNGVWVIPTGDGSARQLEVFGSYRWRSEERLLIVPLETNEAGDGLWEFDTTSGNTTRLFAPGEVEFEIANNDWSVSPDGMYIAFRSAIDYNIWTLPLPAS